MRVFRNFKTIAATVAGVALALAATHAAEAAPIVVNLSPDTDYGSLCHVAQPAALSTDWSTWSGGKADAAPDVMLHDALIYLSGAPATTRDLALGQKMLQYLVDLDWPGRGSAAYQLARQKLDANSGIYDVPGAIKSLGQSLDLGEIKAAIQLGELYLEGDVVAQDLVQAERDLRAAAAANQPEAALRLAQLYLSQPGNANSATLAGQYTQIALTGIYRDIAAGDCTQLVTLGDIFADNHLGDYDPAKAAAWYQAAYRTGNIDAAVKLATIYRAPAGPLVDPAKAQETLTFAANAGNVSAMTDLGEFLLHDGKPEDRDGATGWLERAARNEDVAAFGDLVRMAQGIYGGNADSPKAVAYLERAALLPNVTADLLTKLAKAKESGDGTAVDPQGASEIYQRAAALGNPAADVSLYDLALMGVSLDGQSPIDRLKSAAAAGFPTAMARLGDAYLCGVGGNRDEQQAAQWYQRAADAGDVGTLISLAEEALAGPNGASTYLKYLQKAAALGDGEAMILLSDALSAGVGATADAAAAQMWRDKALNDPNTKAAALIAQARIILANIGPNGPDLADALPVLQQAAATGDSSAAYELGAALVKGGGDLAPNPAGALPFLASAARAGNVAAMLQLASQRVTDDGLGGDWQSWLDRAVERGSIRAILVKASTQTADARHALYDRLVNTTTICDTKDMAAVAATLVADPAYGPAAAKLIQRALSFNPSDASVLYQLSELIAKGALGGDHVGDAMPLLEASAEGGKVEAMRELGKAYFTGKGVGLDLSAGRKWLLAAVQAGDPGAIKEVRQLSEDLGLPALGTDDVIAALKKANDHKAKTATPALADILSQAATIDPSYLPASIDWNQRAAEAGDGGAMLALSNAYALGVGVPKSDQDSARWLKAAAEAGYAAAYPKYAMVLQLGIGTDPDPEGAKFWLAKGDAK